MEDLKTALAELRDAEKELALMRAKFLFPKSSTMTELDREVRLAADTADYVHKVKTCGDRVEVLKYQVYGVPKE